MHLLKRRVKWFVIAIFIIFLDLLTKYIAQTTLTFSRSVEITSFFNLILLYNYGAAFSFLSNAQTSWQLIMLSVISLLTSFMLILIIINKPHHTKINLLCLSLILGGDLGNFYDRAFRGYIIDFLDLHIYSYHCPAFNIADLAIAAGATLFIFVYLFRYKY